MPPSPPNAINLVSLSSGSFPCLFSELYVFSTPDNVAAAFSKAVWINEQFFQEVKGYIAEETSKQPVATETTALSSSFNALKTPLTAGGAPHPEHILCPLTNLDFLLIICLKLYGIIYLLFL
ncbi:hypothetical protein D3C76_1232940 [compost metagenome]